MNKKLILVASPPACGKTYVSERLAKKLEHIVYLDKDDLGDLVRAFFSSHGKALDMDGDFYKENIRDAEYSTLFNIAYSTLRFEDMVLINAPLGKEVRDAEFMRGIRQRANENGAELIFVWVFASLDKCFERMKKRNSDRDTLKLKDWDGYVKKINYTPPYELESVVDSFIIFDNNDDVTFEESMKKTLDIILNN